MKEVTYRMKITPENFGLFKKVLKIVYTDIGDLLIAYKVIEVKVSDGVVKFNDFKLDFSLEENRVMRFLLNLYYLIEKNGHLFKDPERQQLQEEDWFIEYIKFRDAVRNSQKGKKISNSFRG